jgi:membrane protein
MKRFLAPDGVSAFVESLNAWWAERDPSLKLVVGYVWQAVVRFSWYGPSRAAALAYYAVFSIFPLILLLAIGLSQLLGAAVAQQQIASALELFLPNSGQILEVLLENTQQALNQKTPFGVIALVGLAWAGMGVFNSVINSLDIIFQVSRSRSLWRQRLIAALMILVLTLLVAASFLISGAVVLLSVLFAQRASTWLGIASFLVPLSLNMMIFVMLFRFVPARTVSWDAIWPAAVVGAAGFELAKRAFGWYLANIANYQVIYGSIATVIVLLFWAYLLASIFLFSAELCAQLNQRTGSLPESDPLKKHSGRIPPHQTE